MLLNPWLWLAFVLMLAGAGFTGYRQGVKATKSEYEAAAAKAMTAMIERHNELSKADTEASVKAEMARQARRVKQLEKRHEFELEAERNHKPACSWVDIERKLLNDLVDNANGKADTAPSLLDGLRPPAETPRIEGLGGQGLGGKRGLRFWRMSGET